MRGAVLLAPLAVLLLAGSGAAGSYVPPPGDCCAQWSPQGTQIVFTTSRSDGLDRTPTVGVVTLAGSGEHFVPGIPVGLRAPDWFHVAYSKQKSGVPWLAVANVDGSGEQLLAQLRASGDFAWAPDSKRLAFVAADGLLAVIGVDGSGLATIAPRPASSPVWSPNGLRVAYLSGGHLHVVDSGGTGHLELSPGRTAHDPRWSPDSTTLSYLAGSSIVTVRIGGRSRSYALGRAALANAGWFPNENALLFVAEARLPQSIDSAEIGTLVGGRLFQDELVRLDLGSGKRRALSFGEGAVFSPDDTRIAFTSGGECRDRQGIYVVRLDGSGLRRLTNDCGIRGTPKADTLHGTELADVISGFGGNDRLLASDPGYVGDTLEGGSGADLLVGDVQQDTLDGGPGNDTLSGRGSADTLIGGPGRDRLNGEGGRDTIYARDGERDIVTCGPNAFGRNGRDTVYADRLDSVAADCEIVHRG